MKYMGSKRLIAKHISPLIQSELHKGVDYVEPFVGGANMICEIKAPNRTGFDNCKYLIALLNTVSNGGDFPTHINESLYNEIRDNKDNYPDHTVAFAGYGMSFGAKFFGGFARGFNKNNTKRDYYYETIRNLQAMREKISGIKFIVSDYRDIVFTNKSVIYCDPPYLGSTKYKNGFDHKIFYEWAIERASEGHKVFISEYSMPSGFTEIWSKEVVASFHHGGRKKSTEKLFTL